jgi:CRP-like cAMP-binding protein
MSGSESKGEYLRGRTTLIDVEALRGRQILVVNGQDDGAEALRAAFRECGADIIGPVADVHSALDVIGSAGGLDGAVLELDSRHNALLPLVEEMSRRRIPFVFSSPSDSDAETDDSGPGSQIDVDRVLTTLVTRITQRDGALVQHRADAAQSLSRNKLLQIMRPDHFAVLAPHFKRVELKPRETLIEEQRIIPGVWFPETAVVSMLVAAEGSRPIEAGMIGPEGMTDLVLNAGEIAVLRTSVLIPGTALVVPSEAFAAALSYPGFDRFVLAYKESLAVQFAYAALSHGTSTIDARLARWILMLDDRLEGASIPVVHNMIADLLAVRRSGVTTALHVLEGMGAIKSVRGMITVRDRAVLQQLAGATYGPPEAEYNRVMARVSRFTL